MDTQAPIVDTLIGAIDDEKQLREQRSAHERTSAKGGEDPAWVVRTTAGLSDEEVFGVLVVRTEPLWRELADDHAGNPLHTASAPEGKRSSRWNTPTITSLQLAGGPIGARAIGAGSVEELVSGDGDRMLRGSRELRPCSSTLRSR